LNSVRTLLIALASLALAACQSPPPPYAHVSVAAPRPLSTSTAPPDTAPATALVELFPHVRVDRTNALVEFDATLSPMLVPDANAPLFFLEVLACLPDTREHETLLVCKARPSHIHAALLLIGLKPGEPGGWKLVGDALVPIDPTGDALEVRFVYADASQGATPIEADPFDWIISARDRASIKSAIQALAAKDSRPASAWVFAGSRFVTAKQRDGLSKEIYDADYSGTVIGLTTFGSEVIAFARTLSPEAGVEEPEWIAQMPALPPAATPVTVRIRPAQPRLIQR